MPTAIGSIMNVGATGAAPERLAMIISRPVAGFIVISVDVSWFPQNDQAKAAIILNTIALARNENARSGSRFKGAVDVRSVGLAGHSRGGATVVQAAQLLLNPSTCSRDLD